MISCTANGNESNYCGHLVCQVLTCMFFVLFQSYIFTRVENMSNTMKLLLLQFSIQLLSISKFQKIHILQFFSDSLSCLQSLHNMNIDHPYILDILVITYVFLNKVKQSISFGFRATLEFMAILKSIALQNLRSSLKFKIPHTDLKYLIKL